MDSEADVSPVRRYLGSALLGAASGMRSTVGFVAVITQGDRDDLPAALRHRLSRQAAGVAVAVELVLDKMPFTGSRLEPAGMAGRLVLGGAAAGLAAARSPGRPVFSSVLVAAAAAALVAKFAHDLRAVVAKKVPDAAVGVVEDLAALGIAAAGSRC